MRVHIAPTTAPRRRSMLSLTTGVLLAVAALAGFVALHQTTHIMKSAAQPVVGHLRTEVTPQVAHAVQARHKLLENVVKVEDVASESKLDDALASLAQEAGAHVSRHELQEVSEKIATAVRASHNTMDVRKLVEVGTPKYCGPKRNTHKRSTIRRPCVPAPSPPNGGGTCQLCVVYEYPVSNDFASSACSPSVADAVKGLVSGVLTSNFPALYDQLDNLTTLCNVTKINNQFFSFNGPYCRGPVDPAQYSAADVAAAAQNSVADLMSSTVKLSAVNAESTCESGVVTYSSSTTVVGQDNQQLQVTLVCDDGSGETTTQDSQTVVGQCGSR